MRRFRVSCVGAESLAAVVLLACALSLLFTSGPVLMLSANLEAHALAGASCAATPSEPCVVCAVLASCHIEGGENGGCINVGNADGCAIAGTRRICSGWGPYTRCVENTGASICGSSQTAPICVVKTVGGIITECTVPLLNVCAPPATKECQHCTDS